jgi:hypothetical protein
MMQPRQGQELNPKGRLIEDWPRRDMDDAQGAAISKEPKRVRFATYSEMRHYTVRPSYEANKSYTSTDRRSFKNEACGQALEIRRLISSCSLAHGPSIHLLVSRGVLTSEDLLGMEDLVAKTPMAYHHRREHTKLALKKQEEMRNRNNDIVDPDQLAAACIARSSRCVEKAKLRASLAL